MDHLLTQTLAQVRAAQAGDRRALEDLFARYAGWVKQTVSLRLGRPLRQSADLDDVVQESLLDAFRCIESFRERSEGSFRSWLAQIVVNNARDHARSVARRRRLAAPDPIQYGSPGAWPEGDPVADVTPSQWAQANELESRLEHAMLRLSATHREIVILRDRCGMAYHEIAQQLGYKNADTARALHHRALGLLDAAVRK